MEIQSNEIIKKFQEYFKIRNPPIAFYYTKDPPQKIYNPRPRNIEAHPCIIQFLNSVRRGRTMVFSRKSTGLCRGGQGYLGFRKMLKGLEYFLSTGLPGSEPGKMLLDGERFKLNPEIGKKFYENLPLQDHSHDYAVFTPLNNVDLSNVSPDLIIFLLNMDQLGGFVQLFNYDTNDGIKIGLSSACGTIVAEPMAEIGRKPVSRATIGLLSDMLARRFVPPDIVSFTITYERLLQIYPLMDESFLPKDAWQKILKRIK
ncbi:MAG: DUF169 domain-containing protein [Candidatus Helarchaeota archaeon]